MDKRFSINWQVAGFTRDGRTHASRHGVLDQHYASRLPGRTSHTSQVTGCGSEQCIALALTWEGESSRWVAVLAVPSMRPSSRQHTVET